MKYIRRFRSLLFFGGLFAFCVWLFLIAMDTVSIDLLGYSILAVFIGTPWEELQ